MRIIIAFLALPAILLAELQPTAAQSTQYAQTFDEAAVPELPSGWSSPDQTWITNSGVPSPGSGGNNAEITGSAPGALISPVFDLSLPSNLEIQYVARRTATFDSLNFRLEASIDGGASWTVTVLDSTDSLPLPPSTYTVVSVTLPEVLLGRGAVRFRFSTLHTTGGNLRLDDFELVADASISWNRFGFSRGQSTASEGVDSLVVPLGISLIPESDSLQGLEFSLIFSPGLSVVSLQIWPDLTSSEWHTSYETSDSIAKVVVLAEGLTGLPPISTDSLFLLTVRVGPLGSEPSGRETIRIRELLASAVSPTGSDLNLEVYQPQHEVLVVPLAPALELDSSVVDIGTIAPDSTAGAFVRVKNTGTGALHITDLFSISGLLGISPPFLTVPPDSTGLVAITIEASLYGEGPLEDWLVMEHDGSTSPDTVTIRGLVSAIATRGDVNIDGVVDVVDLVLGIDLILERIELPETRLRLDLYPFPDGDQSIDVRDLTVLAQAVARGVWPDGVSVPTSMEAVAKNAPAVGDLIMSNTAEGVELWIRSAEPLRAVQLVGKTSEDEVAISPSSNLPQVRVGTPYGRMEAGSFSILTFGMEDLPISSSQPMLLATLDGRDVGDVQIVSTIAVDRAIERRSLYVLVESSERPSGLEGVSFDAPYPNPVDPRVSPLVRLPIAVGYDARLRLEVTDILGRMVKTWEYPVDAGLRTAVWDIRNASGDVVPAGLYFLTVSARGHRTTHSIVVR